MEKICTSSGLKDAIIELEYRKATELTQLRSQIMSAYEELKLVNVIKSTLRGAIATPSLKANLANAAIGITTGYLAKKTLIGNTHNPIRKLLGMIVEMSVAGKVARNAGAIRSISAMILQKIAGHQKEHANK